MNGFGNWLRAIGQKISYGMRSFMMGRYGTDKLNIALLVTALVLCLLPTILALFRLSLPLVNLVLALASYGLTGYAIFRCFSRNTYKRYEENRRYLRFVERLKDRQHKYFDCPRCRQQVRVPRGKGKITVTCRSCGASFQEKS